MAIDPISTRPIVAGWALAVLRGFVGRCPRCGSGRLFRTYLKQVEQCAVCAEPWGKMRTDDFAPYVTIFVAGLLLVPSILISVNLGMPYTAQTIVWLPVSALLVVILLPRCKGSVLGLTWSITIAARERRGERRADDI